MARPTSLALPSPIASPLDFGFDMADHRPWRLDATTYGFIRDHRYEVAVIPFGATEPHNLHLPYGTDSIEATEVGERICRRAWEHGGNVVLLPTIPYGTETNLAAFPLAMNLLPSTLTAIIRDLVVSLEQAGIRKILLLNSHGGNDFKPVLRELMPGRTAHLFLCDWFRMVQDEASKLFERRDDHAGEMETSFILAVAPELVAKRDDGSLRADDGSVAELRFEALAKGWVGLSRPWHLLTTCTGSGNPHAASAAKGERLLELIEGRLGDFLVELSQAEIDATFPFRPRT